MYIINNNSGNTVQTNRSKISNFLLIGNRLFPPILRRSFDNDDILDALRFNSRRSPITAAAVVI